ncbi:glycosyltransferase, family II [Desulfosarcina variabilis str. Montpellier]|uniref:glycosyltransferase family 2 protein n=1 Tax=Desulfosarcina variabilis TaxID=2300 RepID=UPI003AFA8E6D
MKSENTNSIWLFPHFNRVRRMPALIRQVVVDTGGIRTSLRKAWDVYHNEGFSGIKNRIAIRRLQNESNNQLNNDAFDYNDYQEWIRRYDTLSEDSRQRIKDRIGTFLKMPKISVVMPVYDPSVQFLNEAIESVRSQLYPNWELCIADDASKKEAVRKLLAQHAKRDPRIKVYYRKTNGHISVASNSALKLASGDYIALLDHDDILPEHALFMVAQAIIKNPELCLIYSDEDKITETGERCSPYFKSDFNKELFFAQNMISHLGVYRRDLIDSVGGFRSGFEGSQDWDLALRVIEQIQPEKIAHIPHVLYHWRAIPGSTALASDEKNYAAEAARKAVAEHLERCGINAEVVPAPEAPAMNRVRLAVPKPEPLVSIIIPTKDCSDLLSTCLNSIFNKTTYPAWEIIIVDNGSQEPETKKLLENFQQKGVTVVYDGAPFNYPRLNNNAVRIANGDLICLLNNDIEIISDDWLEEMVSFAVQPEIGCVGARLWYPDGRLQHGGVLLGVGGVANHAHYQQPRGAVGYFGRAVLHQSFSAVTAACMMVRRKLYNELNGLDENLGVAFNDIDFCLRVRQAGYRNVWTPYAELYHHESASRSYDVSDEKQVRLNKETDYMRKKWADIIDDDPYYNINLTLENLDFGLAWPPRKCGKWNCLGS